MDQNFGIASEIVHSGYAYWRERAGAGGVPARRDLDPPIDVPQLIPSVILFDVQTEPLDFVYRVIGTRVRTHLLQDLTGMRMSGIDFQRPPSDIWTHHAWVVENKTPRFMRPPYVGPHREFMFIEAVILPLGSTERVEKLLVFVDFVARD